MQATNWILQYEVYNTIKKVTLDMNSYVIVIINHYRGGMTSNYKDLPFCFLSGALIGYGIDG